MIMFLLKSTKKAFSMIELLITLAVIAFLVVISLNTFGGVTKSSQGVISWTVLDQAIAAAQTRLLPNAGGYPSNLIATLSSNGITFTSGLSTGESVVSGEVTGVLSGGGYENLIFAVLDTGTDYCYVGVDSLGGSPTWAISSAPSASSCSAGNAASSLNNVLSVSQSLPSTITM
jgi:prepilin-type N-terminal cleavage/methylation domain-containing protein